MGCQGHVSRSLHSDLEKSSCLSSLCLSIIPPTGTSPTSWSLFSLPSQPRQLMGEFALDCGDGPFLGEAPSRDTPLQDSSTSFSSPGFYSPGASKASQHLSHHSPMHRRHRHVRTTLLGHGVVPTPAGPQCLCPPLLKHGVVPTPAGPWGHCVRCSCS